MRALLISPAVCCKATESARGGRLECCRRWWWRPHASPLLVAAEIEGEREREEGE